MTIRDWYLNFLLLTIIQAIDMRLIIFILTSLYCLNLKSETLIHYQLAITCWGNVRISVTNKSGGAMKYLKGSQEYLIVQNQELIDTMQGPDDNFVVRFINLLVNASQKIAYKIESYPQSEFQQKCIDEDEVICYGMTTDTYIIEKDEGHYSYEKWTDSDMILDPYTLYVNMDYQANKSIPKNKLQININPTEIDDALKRTLASVAGFMQANFYNEYLDPVPASISSKKKISIESSANVTSSITSCCYYRSDTIHIYRSSKYIEFAYLHELMHSYGVPGDYSTSTLGQFILLPSEATLSEKKYVSIRSNENLFTNKFKLDIISLFTMLSSY
jgi:hypothetical protein